MKYSNSVLLSIIIPCYNVSKYIDRCLTNLINCKYEIILIDDGSTDCTPEICDDYKKYSNITVYHKTNGGLSDARNYGLQNAHGKYIAFLDSDDYVDIMNLEKSLNTLIESNVDMVYCDFSKQYRSGNIKKFDLLDCSNVFSGKDLLDNLLKNQTYYPMVWKNIYKREFIINNNLFFKVGFLHEDEDWMMRCLFKANRVLYLPESFYIYCTNELSITHQKNQKNLNDIIEISLSLKKDLKIQNDKHNRLINDYLNNLYLASYIQSNNNNELVIKAEDIYAFKLKMKYFLCKYLKKVYKIIYKFRLLLRVKNNEK